MAESGPPRAPKNPILLIFVLFFGSRILKVGDAEVPESLEAPEAPEAPPVRFLLRRVFLFLRDLFFLLFDIFDIKSYDI